MKLRAKILLASGLPLLVLVAVVAVLLLQRLFSTQLDLAKDSIRAEAEAIAQSLEEENHRTVQTAATMALAQQNGLFGRRADSVAYARAVLEANPEFTGAYFGYEPDADGRDRSTIAGLDGRALDDTGRFLPYWFRDDSAGGALALTPLVDMETSYYYQGLKVRVNGERWVKPEEVGITIENGISELYDGRVPVAGAVPLMITEPYVYEGKLIVEQTAPIIIDGRFRGLAGVDRALTDIDDFLRGQRTHQSSEFLLISTRGRIISATGAPDLRTLPLERTPYEGWLAPLYRGEWSEGVLEMEDPLSGETRFVVAAAVPTGGWQLVVSVDEGEILGPVRAEVLKTLLVIVAGLMVAAAIAYVFTRALVGRVETAAGTAEKVAGGDLTVRVEAEGSDETGVLLSSLRHMVDSLGGLLGRLKSSSVQLLSTANEITAASHKQEQINNDIGASTSEIAASTSEISATAQELLGVMREVSASSGTTAEVAAAGRTDLDSLQETMQGLLAATSSIAERLEVMAQRAESIGTVVTTITKVADQTNLLSLNAAIEAEKAGEYGAGFAVVSREIRRLADQAAVATLDIGRLVGEVQESVSSGVAEMSRFTARVRDGVREVTALSTQLGTVIEGVESLKPRFDAAHRGMEAQAAGAGQINDAMLQLRDIALLSGESSQATRAASAQLLAAVEDLKTEIARFRTR
ncbi:MAG: methyl-accepting chemotaxis protein [Steroidobacteraceae bacterium]